MRKLSIRQWFLLALAIVGWVAVYVLQEFDYTRMEFRPGQYAEGRIPDGETWGFVINKGLRFFFNDLFSLLFIYSTFNNRHYTRLAMLIMGFGLLILLPAYLILAIHLRESGFNLLVFLHRITMNPWLMLLLIPGFLYQRYSTKNS